MEAHLPKPAIVVAAWNRPHSLRRLLDSLVRGHFPAETALHISIDHFEYTEVQQLADAFVWPFGPKVVEQHPARLGLRQHLLYCGGLSARYGAIILLEDDLAVSSWMYDYAVQALAYYGADAAIAGISLYNYAVAESCLQPFTPWQDGFDNWFLQLPSSWGAAFTAAQWEGFATWLATHGQHLPILPDYIQAWSQQGWKRLFAAYLLQNGKYFAYPRYALSTNFEDYGAHALSTGLFQVPLLMGKRDWSFGRIADSLAVYDIHFEPLEANVKRLCPALAGYDFAVDLLGQKGKAFLDRPWVLTRRRGGEAKLSFGAAAIPLELNLHLQNPGDALRLVAADADLRAPGPLELEFNYYAGPAKAAALHLAARRMPSISIVVSSAVRDPMGVALGKLIAEDYLGKEVIVVVQPGEMSAEIWKAHCAGKIRVVEQQGTHFQGIQKAVASTSGQLILVMTEPVELLQGNLLRLAKIFLQFPGLDWVTGLPHSEQPHPLLQRLALYRWDTARFTDANAAQLQRYLPAALQVYRRALWMQAEAGASTLEAHFQKMSKVCLPQVSTLVMADGFSFPKPDLPSFWGQGNVNETRKYYHRATLLLWKGHRNMSDYRPVLRYDAIHDTWYEFAY
jgi:hypothetical protein